MKKIAFAGVMMTGFAAFAGSAEAVGTDWVVTAAAGESYTNSTAIGNYSRLLKQGPGEVVLTAATTAFTGAVLVQEGTLAITDLKALGTGTPVTVQNGATFYLKTPHSSSQTSPRFTGHVVTIEGDGVNGKGAIRFLPPDGGGSDDSMLSTLNLSGDASIECDYRWGLHGNSQGTLNLNGHTLRRIGTNGAQWLINGATVNGGGGTLVSYNGSMVFQGAVNVSADTTVVMTNNAGIVFWGASNEIPASFRLFPGRTMNISWGSEPHRNRITGPVSLLNHAGSYDGGDVTFYVAPGVKFHVNGTLTGDPGPNSSSGTTFYKAAAGDMFLNGPVSLHRTATIAGGLLAMTSSATRVINNGLKAVGGRIWQSGGNTFANFIRLANSKDTRGAMRITGGVMELDGSAGDITAGESEGSIGCLSLEGGELYPSNGVYVSHNDTGFGSLRQTGGILKSRKSSGYFFVGYRGTAVYCQTGGTNDTHFARYGQNARFLMSYFGGSADATISGAGTLLETEVFYVGRNGYVSTNTVNLLNGAVLKATRFIKAEGAAEGTIACVNSDGGILMPIYAHGWGGKNSNEAEFYLRSPNHFVIWKKGLTVDTSESGQGGSTFVPYPSTMSFWFEKPTGKGVESVALPTDAGFISSNSASNYLGIARVVFEDATGWGASAYAEYDQDSRALTHIVVTSRGCNYSQNVKAYLESHDRKTRYACALTLSDNEGMCGEFVKRGEPILNLFATNTITGGIAVEEGELRIYTAGVIPSNTPVRVESGATLNLNSKGNITVSTFTGAGTVTNGSVTVTNAVRATCAEIFANKHATFLKNLTFAEGAAFVITDPENLDTYAHSGSKPAFTAQAVNGTPTLRIEGSYAGPTQWALFQKSAGTYNFGAIQGTMLLLK